MSHSAAPKDLFTLEGRTVILTGGLGGLGCPLIKALLQYGADVACTDLHATPPAEDWEPLVQVANQHNRQLKYFSCDVTDEQSVRAAVEKALSTSRSRVSGLVTLAGISTNTPAIDHDLALFRRIHEVNVMGTFIAAQAAARIFHEQATSGSIVMIASMSAQNVNQGVTTSAYNSSKAAVVQLARNLAAEWGSHPSKPPIRVNTLSPGYIITNITTPTLDAHPHLKTLWPNGNMLKRLSKPEEYLTSVIFLLGDGSSFMTASDLRIDGGHCAW